MTDEPLTAASVPRGLTTLAAIALLYVIPIMGCLGPFAPVVWVFVLGVWQLRWSQLHEGQPRIDGDDVMVPVVLWVQVAIVFVALLLPEVIAKAIERECGRGVSAHDVRYYGGPAMGVAGVVLTAIALWTKAPGALAMLLFSCIPLALFLWLVWGATLAGLG